MKIFELPSSGYFPLHSNITDFDIKDIKDIKDINKLLENKKTNAFMNYFCPTKKEQVIILLHTFYHAKQDYEVGSTFKELQQLIPPGHKDQIFSVNEGAQRRLQITHKNKNKDVLIFDRLVPEHVAQDIGIKEDQHRYLNQLP